MKEQEYRFVSPPTSNFALKYDDMGYEGGYTFQIEFTVKKTLKARVKYWLFCLFFPFKVVRWN